MNEIAIDRREEALEYLAERTGTYHFRARRYAAVAAELQALGLGDGDLVLDIGAGMCEFGKYLYGSGWSGRYMPIDAAVDGTDVDHWEPTLPFAFIVALELIEHLEDPARFLDIVEANAQVGAVITTPNPRVVDVLALDATHRHAIRQADLNSRGWKCVTAPLFGKPNDTILAVWRKRR